MEKVECIKCGAFNEPDANRCWKCKKPLDEISDEQRQAAIAEKQADFERRAAIVRETGDFSCLTEAERDQFAKEWLASIIITTSPYLYDREIGATIGIVSAECVFGTDIITDVFAGLADKIGGRSVMMQQTFRRARESCLTELRFEAFRLRADAVVSLALDYNEISGGGKSMLYLVATGTAVRVKG